MAVALIMDFDGGTIAQYDAILAEMDLGGQMPPGGLFHGVGQTDTGVRVIDVWETMDAFQRFADASIMPLSAKHGLGEPRVQVVEVRQNRPGPGTEQRFLQVVRIPGVDGPAFEALDEKVLPGGTPPAELAFHVNGPLDDGWCVIDTWTSKEARDAFLENNVRPGVEAAGVTAQPAIEDLEIHNTLRAGAAAPA